MEDKNYKKYTKEERDYIYEQGCKNIDNLSKCFMALSKELGRTPAAIGYQWWYNLTNPKSKHYRGTSTMLITKKAVLVNRKQENPTFAKKTSKVSFWKNVLKMFNNIILRNKN